MAAITPVDEREIPIDSVIRAQRAGTIRQLEVNFMNPDLLAEIHPETYDAVLMIARPRLGTRRLQMRQPYRRI